MNAGEQLLNALGDGQADPLAAIKQQATMKVCRFSVASSSHKAASPLRLPRGAIGQDNMNFHFRIVKGCFENCCKPPFTTKRVTRDEKHCIETCFGKMM